MTPTYLKTGLNSPPLANSGRFLEARSLPSHQHPNFSLEGFAPGFVEAERVERLINDLISRSLRELEILRVATKSKKKGWNGEYKIAPSYGQPFRRRVSWIQKLGNLEAR